MSTWPSTLPQKFAPDSFSLTYGKNTIRSKMSQGSPKSRRQSTLAPQLVTGSMEITAAQFTTFNTFYKTTIYDGADSFDWLHPIDEGAESFMFTEEPVITPAGGTNWNLDMQMEIQA